LNNDGRRKYVLSLKVESSGRNHSQEGVSLSKEEWEGSSQTVLLARRAEEGMEPDDLLCSRNARPQKALVGRAQWKINQPPSLERETSKLGRIIWKDEGRSMRAVGAQTDHPPVKKM
jgi:hypothetical protein